MKRKIGHHDRVNITLRRLEQYPTLSPFCRMFYRVLYEWLGEAGLDGKKLDQAFNLLLRCECLRHRTVGDIVRKGEFDLLDMLRVGRHAQVSLSRIKRAIERMEPSGAREAMLRELLLAECSYHLGQSSEVIESLRRALRLGCGHPLVHFALGYNLYQETLEAYARPANRKGEIIVRDLPAFRRGCRRAIAAFEQGLGDSRFDAQIHWWIGLISEIIGEYDDACAAYAEAMACDPDNFAEAVRDKLRHLRAADGGRRSALEEARLSGLGPITDEDLRLARAELDRSQGLPPAFFDA